MKSQGYLASDFNLQPSKMLLLRSPLNDPEIMMHLNDDDDVCKYILG